MNKNPTLEELQEIMERNGSSLYLRNTGITNPKYIKLENGMYVPEKNIYMLITFLLM